MRAKIIPKTSRSGSLWENNPVHIHSLKHTHALSCHTRGMFTHEAHRLSHPLKPVQSIRPMTLLLPSFHHLQPFLALPPSNTLTHTHKHTHPEDSHTQTRTYNFLQQGQENDPSCYVSIKGQSEGKHTVWQFHVGSMTVSMVTTEFGHTDCSCDNLKSQILLKTKWKL